MIKKGDILIVVCMLLLACVISIFQLARQEAGGRVVVTFGNGEKQTFPLSENREIEFKEKDKRVVLSICDQTARISESNCPHQYCVKMGRISKTGETAVCLPNRFIIEIESDSPKTIDAVTM